MSLPNELHPLQLGAGSAAAYEIEQSLRFDGSSKLSRTPSSAGTTTTWTLSYWIKIGSLTAEQAILSAPAPGGGYTATWYIGSRVKINQYNHPTNVYSKCPTPVYRDPSAWFHVVVVYDSTNATADDRVRFYVNGVRLTDFSDDGSSVGGTTNPSQNQTSGINNNSIQYIGSQFDGTYAFTNSYLAEMHLLDGTAVTNAEDFGELDGTGVWRPIEVSGVTYGTNGWYMKFDPSATNGIGHDHSGNGNNFTASGFTTSGTGTDVMDDTPTTNWCTLNPLDSGEFGGGITLSEGNLKSVSTSSDRHVRSTFFLPTSGKWYWEMTATTVNTAGYLATGLYHATGSLTATAQATPQLRVYAANGDKSGAGSASVPWGATYDDGDIIGIAVDMDAGKIWAAKNNTWQASGDPVAGTNPMYSDLLTAYSDIAWSPVCANWQNGNTADFNFGQREFAYPPGTASATSHFNTVLWTGDGSSSRAITGVGFQPDLVWVKGRSFTSDQCLTDVVRGVNAILVSSDQGAESVRDASWRSNYGQISSFDSDGFTISTGSQSSLSAFNRTSNTHVAWCWKAGGSASSNTDGSITSSVSANQTGGFSVVTWTGSTTNGNVGHGLGTAPSMIIFKRRNNTTSWPVYHTSLGASQLIYLNETGGKTSSGNGFGSTPTSPTSSVFYVGDKGDTNYGDMVAYCFAEKSGLSKFGSYTGNGSSTGPFVECGFKPRFVMLKRDDSTSDWFMYDTIRGTNNKLYAEATSAENAEDGGSTSSNTILSLSNGFQLTSGNGSNSSGGTYIFMAFAENFSADSTYKALNTANLPAPSIKDGSKNFNTVLYNGNGSTQSITGVGFQPDWVWLKSRNNAYHNYVFDVIRGTGKQLYTNLTNEEFTSSGTLTSFDTDGFSLGNSANADINNSSATFVAWNWLAGGSGSSNTSGSITSTVSANPTAGFSIVSYTGNQSSTQTVGHGLGVAPSFIVVKDRDNAERNWVCYHKDLGFDKLLLLNGDNAAISNTGYWGSSITSTIFSLPAGGNDNNPTGDNLIAYCFAEVEGYSKIGSFVGNGNADGPFVFCGFRPAYVWLKGSTFASNWNAYDSARDQYNITDDLLRLNSAAAEVSDYGATAGIDLLSNGFKIRTSSGDWNSIGQTFVFCAFAENPFGGSGVSPATAR